MNNWHAYSQNELEKHLQQDELRTWYKSGLLSDKNWAILKVKYQSNLYQPTVFMRILLFVATYLGVTTLLLPVGLLFASGGVETIRFFMLLLGVGAVYYAEAVLIRQKQHYKSGMLEAAYYTGFSFFFGAIFFDAFSSDLPYLGISTVILAAMAIRYLDLFALVGSLATLLMFFFQLFEGQLFLLPFMIMGLFSVLFGVSQWLQTQVKSIVWKDHFVILDTVSLLLVYLSGNYFVVREMSINLIGLELTQGQDIPFALVFQVFTVLVPFVYLYFAIKRRSTLLLRVSLLILALSAATIKYYYIPSHSGLGTTLAGAILLGASLLLFRYLKVIRNGFTRENVMTTKWDNSNLSAFVASQTLGGNTVSDEKFAGKGGSFGGGGATGEY